MKAFLAVLFLTLLLAGCATYQGAKQGLQADLQSSGPVTAAQAEKQGTLQARLTTDLTEAIKESAEATDPVAPLRHACYTTLLSLVPELPQIPTLGDKGATAGIFTTFERGAEFAENAATLTEFQIPPDVRVLLLKECGPVAQAARDLLLKFNIKVARVAGRTALLAK